MNRDQANALLDTVLAQHAEDERDRELDAVFDQGHLSGLEAAQDLTKRELRAEIAEMQRRLI